MSQDRPYIGILLMLGFSLLAPIGDAMVKLLGDLIAVGVFIFYRFAIQSVLLAPLVWRGRLLAACKPGHFGLIFLRTLFHMVGIGAMFMALRYLPLADAIAIAFVMPFLQLILGKVFLNEEVGMHRIAACCVGFVGTLLVIQPSFVAVGLPALWPLLVAVAFSLFMLVGRQIAQQVDPVAIQMSSGAMAALLLLPLLLLGRAQGWEAFSLALPQGTALSLMLAAGVIGTLAHLLMTWSLRFAPSATLAPLSYVELPVTTLVGFAVFGDLPNTLAAIGIVVTVSAGLYIVFRERASHRAALRARLPHSQAQPEAGLPASWDP
ncbi:DMT family transporter [Cognatishimia sp. SS12]|uniref:DMT family transporter n=1 Tax=Cognatishimia sp. SS12 TaxID=2979465 RepID=UPI00232CF9AF|nr:DMT family transporter [Cognatishimia sp. SS12]MDC0736799.1 DMT family transporter [Cognatishimia sp. SS12]